MQRVTKETGAAFSPVEKALTETFLPTLFGDESTAGDNRRNILAMPINWSDLAIPDPTTMVQANYNASILYLSLILAAFWGVENFNLQPTPQLSLRLGLS